MFVCFFLGGRMNSLSFSGCCKGVGVEAFGVSSVGGFIRFRISCFGVRVASVSERVTFVSINPSFFLPSNMD